MAGLTPGLSASSFGSASAASFGFAWDPFRVDAQRIAQRNLYAQNLWVLLRGFLCVDLRGVLCGAGTDRWR